MSAKDVRRYPRGILDPAEYGPKARRSQAPVTLQGLLRERYPDPEAFTSAEQFAKAHHDDIPTLSDQGLDDERLLARFRRAAEPRPSSWLVERVARLEAEAQRRRERQEA